MNVHVKNQLIKKALIILSYLFIPAYSTQLMTVNHSLTTIRKK